MRKHAILDDNVVVEILDLDEESYAREAAYHQLIIDVQDLITTPQVGWILTGNQLGPAPGHTIALKDLIQAKIKLYQDSAPELLRGMYTANTLLGITVMQSDAMFTEFQDVLIRIREGAWPTALYSLSQKQPSGFVTQQMIDNWISLLQSRMT